MDWQDIRTFNDVILTGSFSAAARASGTTQATVSRRIKSLEDDLGFTLFQRDNTGSTLTEEGRRLALGARHMRDGFEEFLHAQSLIQEKSRCLTVTCGPLIGLFLSKRIAQLQLGLESTEIEIKTTSEFLNLEKGEADVALRNIRPEKGLLKSKKLVADEYGPFAIYGSARFFEPQNLPLSALKNEPWAGYGARSANLPTARWIDEKIGQDAVKFRLNSAALILEVIQENRALAILPRFIGAITPGLIEVHGPVEDLFFDLWIVRRSASDEDQALLRLIENIESLMQ